MKNTDRIDVSLRAEGPGPDIAIRLRRFLKGALRGYGLRCTAIAAVEAQDVTPGHGMDIEAADGTNAAKREL